MYFYSGNKHNFDGGQKSSKVELVVQSSNTLSHHALRKPGVPQIKSIKNENPPIYVFVDFGTC